MNPQAYITATRPLHYCQPGVGSALGGLGTTGPDGIKRRKPSLLALLAQAGTAGSWRLGNRVWSADPDLSF